MPRRQTHNLHEAVSSRKSRASTSGRTKTKKKRKDKPKLSRLHKPEGMSLEDWQLELRRQFGPEQAYAFRNLGDEPVFSEFEIYNPQSKRAYRILIRGDQPYDNYCSCPDFATNTLGTCKHVEYTLARLKKKKGVKTIFKDGFHPEYSEVYLHYGVQREVRFRAGSECSAELARLVGKFFNEEGVLQPEAFAAFDIFLSQAVELEPEMRIADDAVAFVAEVRDVEQRRLRISEAFPQGIRSAAFNELVNVEMYEYQKEGVLFAARAGRCLIGDEMGLGKTIQSIAAAEIMGKLFGVERVLVVCPTSLKHQWKHEIERFVERSVEVIGGHRGQRDKAFSTDTFFKITNYDTVYMDLDLIERWSPELVILDEAQRIKNWSTRTARSVKRVNSPYCIVLTGTPLENRLEELISIIQFVDHHRLGPTFKLLHDHQVRDENGKVVGYQNLDKIGRTLEPVLIRRRKDEVLNQLPERIDTNIFVPMTSQQMQIHIENMEIVARIVAKWRRYKFLSEADQRRLMIALERMRMVCDNTYLVDHKNDHGPKASEVTVLLDEIFERPDAKVVIFSQWLRMHELIVRRLQQREWYHVLFHGGLTTNKRKDMVNRFREDPDCRVFLATDAAGVGLNLQNASVVMNMDIPWNPAVLEQRIGRCHRLGQKQTVRVINFVAQGAMEEGMLNVIQFKKSLFAGVLDGGAKDVFLGRKLDKFMEQVEACTGAVPETMVDDTEDSVSSPGREIAEPDTDMDVSPAQHVPKQAATETAAPMIAAASGDPWGNLLQTGMTMLTQLFEQTRNGGDSSEKAKSGSAAAPGNLVQRDEQTGETFLKLPVPSADIVEQALQTVSALLERLRK